MMPAALLLLLATGVGNEVAALAPLRDYVGHCWVAELPGGAVDRHCFRPVFGGKHVRDEHVVTKDGRQVYGGETIYSAEGKGMTFTYWNSLGGVGRGSASTTGGVISFRLVMRATPDGAEQEVRTTWRRAGAGYEVSSAEGVRRFRLDD